MFARLYRPPFLGALAFLLVLLVQALGHTQMVLMERLFGQAYVYHVAIGMGVLGCVLVYLGVRYANNEVAATWLGFFGGSYIWDGWVEFAFVYYANHLGVPAMNYGNGVITKPEYLVMSSSVGVLMSTLAFFFFNRETRCNAFRWMHKNLHLPVGRATVNYQRNISTITAMEVIYITWFCYLVLLAIYDPSILGDRHPITYAIFFANTVWAVFLLNRLAKFSRMTSAIRYAIPTAIITWNSVEILGRWRTLKEIWLTPQDHTFELLMMLGAPLLATAAIVFFPGSKAAPDEQPA